MNLSLEEKLDYLVAEWLQGDGDAGELARDAANLTLEEVQKAVRHEHQVINNGEFAIAEYIAGDLIAKLRLP